ncbi:hypothetical protein [Epilithonimonas bovis]|uniref:hypothetical protein n=1 Tax=Epilithonimonas bovis TaxID=421530 RepID=UPI0013564E59|nr:hypothetical protein [Epilithonimonas bovis]QIY84845.1 hypothetical protein HER18_15580 [Chryseobacterium sp. NEB161]
MQQSTICATSGMSCPASGEWEVAGPVGTTAYFEKGQILPLYFGKSVVWQLIREG